MTQLEPIVDFQEYGSNMIKLSALSKCSGNSDFYVKSFFSILNVYKTLCEQIGISSSITSNSFNHRVLKMERALQDIQLYIIIQKEIKENETEKIFIKITQISTSNTDTNDIIQNLQFFLSYYLLSKYLLRNCHVPGNVLCTADIKISMVQYFPSRSSGSEILPRTL